jgi:hypothetical protein
MSGLRDRTMDVLAHGGRGMDRPAATSGIASGENGRAGFSAKRPRLSTKRSPASDAVLGPRAEDHLHDQFAANRCSPMRKSK